MQPFLSTGEDTSAPGLDGFMSQPAFKIFGQSERGGVTAARILLQALEANRGKIAIYFWIEQSRRSRLTFHGQPNRFVGCNPKEWRLPREHLVEHCAQSVNIHRCC